MSLGLLSDIAARTQRAQSTAQQAMAAANKASVATGLTSSTSSGGDWTDLDTPIDVGLSPTPVGGSIAPVTYLIPFNIPSTATRLRLDAKGGSGNNNSTGDAELQVRRDSNQAWRYGLYGRVANTLYGCSQAAQFEVEISSSRAFQYQVLAPGFSNVLSLRILAYR